MPSGPASLAYRTRLEWLALVAILISAFSLRIYDLNWDDGKFLHPDELFVTIRSNDQVHFNWPPDWAAIKDPDTSPLNPRSKTCGEQTCNYSYGALPLLITDFAAGTLASLTGDPWDDFDHIPRVGRAISAAVDTITVLLIFLVASRLFTRKAALLAALVYAGTPMAIQLSHFYTTDIWLACFVTLTIWLSLVALDRERHGWFALAGAAFGFAMASKGSALLLAGVVALAAVFVAYRAFQANRPDRAVYAALSRLVVSGASAVVAFAIFEPYALIRMGTYINQLREQQQMSSGEIDFPFTRRYVGTTPVIYQIEQLARWGMGPIATILAFAGVALMIWMAIRRRRADIAIVLAWLGLQSIVIFTPEVKFLRYQIPAVPVLAVGSGVAIWAGYSWLRSRLNRSTGIAFLTLAMVGISFWTAAFTSIYRDDHPRVAASKWIYANVPMGSAISSEDWDDSLPVSIGPMQTPGDMHYEGVPFDIYGDRPQAEVSEYLYRQLSQADFVVLSSNRVMESVRQLPWRYPVQIRYYDLLQSGELGFTLVADFHTQPSLGPFSFDDSLADESWVNYDHPRVLIFQKTGLVDPATYRELMAPAIAQPWQPVRHNEQSKSLMLDEPVGELTKVGNFRWSESITKHSAGALAIWVGLLVLSSLVGRQWARFLFPRFPDGGAGMQRVITLMLSGWLLWFLASLKVVTFNVIWSWLALLVVALVGYVVWRALADTDRRFPLPAIAGAEVAFWSVFALFLAFRWINPDSWHPIWGGEKPMEFAHLNATLRSANFPPYDPWYSGGYINYYYYGLYLVAYCIKLTGIPAEIAFNLAQPTVMGFMASTAYSLAAALGSSRRRASQTVASGLLATVLVVLIGNLDAFFKLIKFWPDIEPTFGVWTWDPSRAISNAITEFPYFTGLYADLHAHGINVPISLVALAIGLSLAREPWLTTYALNLRRLDRETVSFATRLGLMGLAVGSVATTNSWDMAEYVAFTVVALFMATIGIRPLLLRLVMTGVASAIVGGIAAVLFSPFYANYVALFTTVGRTRDETSVIQIANHLGGLLAIVGVGGSALLLAGLRRRVTWLVVDPVLPLTLAGVGLITALTTNLGDASNGWTVKLAAALVCLVLAIPLATVVGDHEDDWIIDAGKGLVITALVAEFVLILDGRGTLALALAYFSLGAAIWVFSRDRGERLTGAMVACAAGVFGAIEVVFLEDNLSGGDAYRMNTIFKFYNQVWVLLAIAGAVMLGKAFAATGLGSWLSSSRQLGIIQRPTVGGDADRAFDGDSPRQLSDVVTGEAIAVAGEHTVIVESQTVEIAHHVLMNRRWAWATLLVGAAVILMSLAYPILATGPRLRERFDGHPGPGSLNGYDWMTYGTIRNERGDVITFDGDRDAIYWFINEVQGSPVIMEASIGPYRGNGSRFSINTGLPAVIGWGNHETQQRYLTGIGERENDVREFYNSTDSRRKMEILDKYGVEYVIVGDVERYTAFNGSYWADPAGIAAIEQMLGRGLEIAYQSGPTAVYRVVRGY